jgi:hypothetical protein
VIKAPFWGAFSLCLNLKLIKNGGNKMRLLMSVFMMIILSSALAFGMDITNVQAGAVVLGSSGTYSIIKSLSGFTVSGLAMEVCSDITGVTERSSIRVFKPICGIGIKTNEKLSSTTGLSPRIKIDLVNSRTGKTKVITPFAEIRHLMEINIGGEGLFKSTSTDTFGIIDITNNRCAYDLDTDDYFNIELDRLTSAKTYEVFGIESPYKGGKLIKYESFRIPAGEVSRVFGCKGALLVGINLWTLERVKVTGSGFSTEMLVKELAMLAYRDNDLVCESEILVGDSANIGTEMISQGGFGYANLFQISTKEGYDVFDVNTVEHVEIITAGTDNTEHFIVWLQE